MPTTDLARHAHPKRWAWHPAQLERVIRAVLGRLARGRFSEQFRDQLRLVLRLAPEQVFAAARGLPEGAPEHARRHAAWVLSHERRGQAANEPATRLRGGKDALL